MKVLLFFLFYILATVSAEVNGPLTQDFQSWLSTNGYQADDFVRADYGTKGSYGGRTKASDKIVNTPVIFIHGNSDSALKTSSSATGWDNSIEYFLKKGYNTAELYATSWQDNNAFHASSRTHNCHDLNRLRRFVQAVLGYTGAKKISLVTHSMGVTLMRKVVKGGKIDATDGTCDLGNSISRSVEVFVGLAGANYGLCSCEGASELEATCNDKNGLFPGDSCGLNYLTCGLKPLPWPCSNPAYASFLVEMNNNPTAEGDYVFSAWSLGDNLILYEDEVWGRPTSYIPTSNGKKVYTVYTHMETKELTAEDQYTFVHDKTAPA